jgi:hypothetical protein
VSTIHTDPATGRQYRVNPATGTSEWVDQSPAPGGAYQQPWQAPAQRKGHPVRNTLLIIGGVLVGITALSAALSGGKGSSTLTTTPAADTQTTPAPAPAGAGPAPTTSKPAAKAQAKPAAPKKPGVGTPVRDGKFEFTVLKVKAGPARIGDEYLGKTAQGQFLLVTVKVENIGDKAQLFAGSSQQGFDAKGRTFNADDEAAIYLGDAKSFLTEINPGNTVTGVIVFDVPKGTQLNRLELHDSMFSGGVEVALP